MNTRQHQLMSRGYVRLLRKLGSSGRLVSMGENRVNNTISYTVRYAPAKKPFTVVIPLDDEFTDGGRRASVRDCVRDLNELCDEPSKS